MEAAAKQQQKCLICLELFAQVVELQPCGHVMCPDCFLVFPHKLKSTKCPACTQEICTFGSDKQNFHLLVESAKLNGQTAECDQDLIGETLDH